MLSGISVIAYLVSLAGAPAGEFAWHFRHGELTPAPGYTWCKGETFGENATTYYSKVFVTETAPLTDYAPATGQEIEELNGRFERFLEGRIGVTKSILSACWSGKSRGRAEKGLDEDAAANRRMNRLVAFTDWEP